MQTRLCAIVLPAKNEAPTIGEVILDFTKAAEICNLRVLEVVVIDDSSTDETADRARAAGARVLGLAPETGLAAAHRKGISEALSTGAELIIHVDSDAQYGAHDLPILLQKFDEEEAALALGVRLTKRPCAMTRGRYVMNTLASWIVSRLAATRVSDSQTGFRIMRSSFLESSFVVSSRFTYVQEGIIRTGRSGGRVVECPINFYARSYGDSRLVRSSTRYTLCAATDLLSLLTWYLQNSSRSPTNPVGPP